MLLEQKTGESSQIIYPDGFVTAIGSIGGGENWNTAIPHFTIVLKEDNTYEFGSDAPELPLQVIKGALDNGELYFVKFSRTIDDELIEFLGIALYANPRNLPYNAMFGCLEEVVEINGRTGQYTEIFPSNS